MVMVAKYLTSTRVVLLRWLSIGVFLAGGLRVNLIAGQPVDAPGVYLAASANTNPASQISAAPRQVLITPESTAKKKKAGFLAAAGLVALSLLVLGTGLALLRAFKQR